MRNIPTRVLLRIFLRTFFIGAAYNMRGLQNVGFMYAMAPGLAAIHATPQACKQAMSRYVRNHNCHPFWTPLIAGMFLRTEAEIANGRMAETSFTLLKDTAANTLSAIGDSVFGGTALATWGLVCALLLAVNMPLAAAALTLFLFVALLLFKAATFAAGLRYGLSALLWLRRWDLINRGDWLKIVNAALLLLLLALLVPQKEQPALWAAAVCGTVLAAWLVGRAHIPRTALALVVALIFVFCL